VHSIPGEGATFWFTARLAAPAVEAPDAPGLAHVLEGRRVLIVDDNATNRSLLLHQVEAWGMRPDSAADGPQALAALLTAVEQGARYELAILDMHMPGMDGMTLARAIKAIPTIAAVRLVLLTSASLPEEAHDMHETGIELSLSKPICQSRLYNSLVAFFGASVVPSSGHCARSALAVPQVAYHGHILLAEDDPVNQEVACSMLEILGYRVQVVANGRDAVDALAHTTYDLVLMDCGMPEMDGLEATRAIRAREAAHGQAPLPIIALTAHAMIGYRAQCLSAGMDDYLSKPFTPEQLHLVLARWLPHASEPSVSQGASVLTQAPAHPTPRVAPLDPQTLNNLRALQRAGTPCMLDKVVQLYYSNAPRLLATLREAVARGDAPTLQHTAHRLKSSSGNVGALGLVTLCQDLESMGREHCLTRAAAVLATLETEYVAVQQALEAEVQKG